MNPKKLPFTLLLACGLALGGGLRAQEPPPAAHAIQFPKLPDASPACTLRQRIGLTDVEIVYSRPSMRRHTVFGGIVPYGEVWRTGANASTKINFSTEVKLNGVEIPAGKYALYTIPDEKEWTVIIYKDPGLWGAFNYDATKDLARIKAAPVKLAEAVETFTIDFNDVRDDSATLNLSWGRTRVPVKLTVDIVGDLLVKIEGSMSSPEKKQPATYLQAATFYFNHSQDPKDLTKALLWVDTGLVSKPPIAFELLHLKAQILAKAGDKAGAMAAAQESSTLAIQAEGPGSSYVKMNMDIISSLRQ